MITETYRTLLCSLVVAAGVSGVEQTRKPNVLLVISDDQGYGEFGFTGNPLVQTPNIDRLAGRSAVYGNFVVAPACSPTRSSLLTGRNHLRLGVWGVGPRGDIRRDEVLMPQFFKKAGYRTWLIGKQDSNSMMELGPSQRGYDWWATIGGGYLQKNPIIFSPGSGKTVPGWTAEIMTDAVIEKVREAGNNPWFAYVAYIIPHLPWACPDSYAKPYRNKGCSEPLSQCYGSITQMDNQIGRLLNAVREAGQQDNTIVVFLSDNGPTEGVPAWVNNNYKNAQNSPDWQQRNPLGLTGHKAEIWENGIRSPLLISLPGRISPGNRQQFAAIEDLLPTLLDLASVDPQLCSGHQPFDGLNLRESLKQPQSEMSREIFRLAMAGPGEPGGLTKGGIIEDPASMDYEKLHTTLRGNRYKFHHLPGGQMKVFDILSDPGEKNDLSAQHPELAREMATRCRREWDGILATGRPFWMAHTKITNSETRGGSWTIHANQALSLRGEMSCVFTGGCRGFINPGDRVDYHVEVEKGGLFIVSVSGKGLDRCAQIQLLINGLPISEQSRSAEEIRFGQTELQIGMQRISLEVPAKAAAGAAPGVVDTIVLRAVR